MDTFNNVSRDEDNILDQIYIYKVNMFGHFYEDLKFQRGLKKMPLNKYSSQERTHKIGFSDNPILVCISV